MKKVLLTTLCVLSLHAEELDDLLGGFDEEIKVKKAMIEEAPQEEKSWFSLRGDYTFSTAYNYQDSALIEGVTRLRNSLNLTMDMQLAKKWKSKVELKTHYDPIFSIRDTKVFTDTLETESEIKEAYIQGTMGKFDLKIGRQITVWGKSDNIRITDVINPLDNREAGMVDIEDLRLPVVATKLSYFTGDVSFKLSIIHESRVQKEAAVGTEFFPTSMFPSGFTVPAVIEPDSGKDNTQYALSIDGVFTGWDLSLYVAKVLDQRWHISSGSRIYDPIKMAGFAVNVASGSWIVKSEAAYLQELIYNTTTDPKSRLDLLLGLEYSGFKDITTSLEVANRHIYNYETKMVNPPDFVKADEMQTAFRTSYVFDHDNATLTYLISIFADQFQNGGFQRMWVEYDLSDTIQLTGGFIDYDGGEKPYFEAIKNNDKVFFDFKYSF